MGVIPHSAKVNAQHNERDHSIQSNTQTMKPRSSRIRTLAIPMLIVQSSLISPSLAAVISPGLDGNRIVTASDNGTNTIVANGGTDSSPEIIIQSGVSLSGDPILQNALVTNAPNYTVFNSGNLSGALGGVVTSTSNTITNDGIIVGNTGLGINMGANATLTNSGLISGAQGVSAINGSLITNSGVIQATALGGNAFLGGLGTDTLVLNQDSALLGNVVGGGGLSDTITLNGGLSTPGGSSNYISGDVLGFQSITKGANGGVALIGTVGDVNSGLNVTANNIRIDGGGLYINADIAGNTTPLSTIVANGAAIGGTGVWNADLSVVSGGFSAGAIPINLDSDPTNSVGFVAVNGSVTHSPNSFVRVDVIPDTIINAGVNSDLVQHTRIAGGSYQVSGMGVRLAPTDINRVITPGTYTIIDSDVAILGTGNLGPVSIQFNGNVPDTGFYAATGSGANYMDSVLANYFVTPSVTDAGTDLSLGVDYNFSALPGISANEASLAGALDTLALTAGSGSLGFAEQDLIAALALSDLLSVQGSLAALNPEASLMLGTSVVNSNYRTHRMIQDHLAFTRNSSQIESYSPGTTTMDAKGGMIQAEPMRQTSMNRGNLWGSLSYDQQDFQGGNNQSDFDGDVTAVTVGIDFRISEMFLLGALIDGSRGDLDHSFGRGSDVESLRGAIYGTYGASKGVYADFLVGYGTHEFDRSGSNAIGVLPSFGDSAYEAESLQALFTVGYAMGTNEVTHGPFAGVEYQQVDVDRFNHGGGPVQVVVSDQEIESLRGLIGYRINGNYGAFRPYASVAYAHEFEDDVNGATATIGGTSFSVAGAELQSAILVTAGFGYAFNDQLMMDLGYRGDITATSDGMTSHGASLGLKYGF